MRNKITMLVRDAALSAGYTFFNGFPYRISQTRMEFPAVWLAPVQLVGLNGREQGTATYKVSLYLIEPNGGKDELQKEELWARMEVDAIGMVHALADVPAVFGVRNVQCIPGEFSLTSYGELSMNATMEVEILFCNDITA